MSIIVVFRDFSKYLFKEWIMFIPSRRIRMFFLRRVIYKMGKDVFIGRGVDIQGINGKILIGNNVVINNNVTLDARGGDLCIGDNVDIGRESNIWTQEHDPHDDYHSVRGENVIIEDYVWIATRVTILPGVRIGRGAIVGTGAVVTRDVEPMAIVVGIPARKIGVRRSKLKYTLKYNPMFM